MAARRRAHNARKEERMILMALVLPALLGGLLLAVALFTANRRPSSGVVTRTSLEPMSPDLINMAHIKVAGIGGLGMLGAVLVTALALPEIAIALVTGIGVGAALAVGLIAYRSRSNAAGPGGPDRRLPTVFALDDRAESAERRSTGNAPGAPLVATA
jgi:hypothetical protein